MSNGGKLRLSRIALGEFGFRGGGFPSMTEAEDDRDEEKGRYGGEEQAADDGASDRGILLAAFAEAEAHGKHADDHGQGSHEHRAQPGRARRQGRGEGFRAFAIVRAGK